ncbi:Macrophage infectivity potentiator-related protein [Methylophaga thiooxydans]|uniref:Macrophage infectivity potentiator-related protein n=1 Tax=Methylophaga thiooxydans TaxID=392484 RepID=A0A0A0BF53_9GAMM|nr:carboxymuconolactone decarboxylase family protein [Methylophaga thiooxydans]KGM06282.1 Macrophage infectivity potentiator-related protein [Methylophaga thiooxydans]
MYSEYKLTVSPITDDNHETLVLAKKNLGFIPNMYRNMATAPGLLETYLYGYEQFREQSAFTAAEQELIFLTISRENGCEYCMSAHSMIADKISGLPTEVTEAIRNDDSIADKKLAALYQFTKVMHERRGLPKKREVKAFLAADYSERHILDIVTAMAVKTLSNYTNHLFHTQVDDVFADWAWSDR